MKNGCKRAYLADSLLLGFKQIISKRRLRAYSGSFWMCFLAVERLTSAFLLMTSCADSPGNSVLPVSKL